MIVTPQVAESRCSSTANRHDVKHQTMFIIWTIFRHRYTDLSTLSRILHGTRRFEVHFHGRLDYCNSLLTGVQLLESVQNAAARPIGLRDTSPRPHRTSSYNTPLASGVQESDVQDCGVGVV